MKPSFAMKLGFRICKTDVSAQKIDRSRMETDKMIIALFQVVNKNKNSCFLEETFSMADSSMDVVFRMLFISLSNVEVNLNNRKLR